MGSVVVFAQAAIGASTLAFGEFDWWLRTTAQPVPLVLGLLDRMGSVGQLPSGDTPADGMPAARSASRTSTSPTRPHQPVFDGFDLTIPAGQSLAIVGQNGAGKTTLAKLICRLYDPEPGPCGSMASTSVTST